MRAERKSSESIAFRPTEPPPPLVSSTATRAPEGGSKRTGKRQRQSIREDDVGEAAARFGSSPASSNARPRLVRSRKELAGAPIDHRDAFVMSLIDGQMTVQMLVDIAGMPEQELVAILTRLRRLGIISY